MLSDDTYTNSEDNLCWNLLCLVIPDLRLPLLNEKLTLEFNLMIFSHPSTEVTH